MFYHLSFTFFFFFNDTATTEIYTLSLHDALPISDGDGVPDCKDKQLITPTECQPVDADGVGKCPEPDCCKRSEEHTSELQSLTNLVCRLLLEKKKVDKLLYASQVALTCSIE